MNEYLSKREIEVLQLIEAGLTNREIAQRIIVETGTVKRHVHNILSKLNARNRIEAVARAREMTVSVYSFRPVGSIEPLEPNQLLR